jgi:hypothetical protein
MVRVSPLAKAALVALPVMFLGACGMFEEDRAATATVTDVGARQQVQQSAARSDRLEQERIYQRDLRK